jgi:hypothetical protein
MGAPLIEGCQAARKAVPVLPRGWGRFFWNFGASQESIQGSRLKGPPKLCREKTPHWVGGLGAAPRFRAGAVSFGRLKNHEGKASRSSAKPDWLGGG